MIIIMATSKTWTRTLKNLDVEKPGPYEKHESWKTWNKYGIKNVFRELCSIKTMRNVV